MPKWKPFASLALLCAQLPSGLPAGAQTADAYRLSGPSVHGNLAIYFVHGQSRPGPVPLTLQEALSKKLVEIRETGRVNELEVKNTGGQEIYIQSGDIVKGGRQDRVLSVSMILPPHSGVIPVRSFCVEQHRWSERAGDDATVFANSNAILPSRVAKMGMRAPSAEADRAARDVVYARQEKIWHDVTVIQGKLSSSLGAPVAAPSSQSSLQLALENKNLERKQAAFVASLQPAGVKESDIVGYVFAVNGRLNSAEIYPSNGLFRKMWPVLLRASATEAIADRDGAAEPVPSIAKVSGFLDGARGAHGVDEAAGATARVNVRQSTNALLFEARPSAAPAAAWINRSYLAK